jgi:hypothetical protein
MRDFKELNQQVNEAKRMLNSFIQKLIAQVEKLRCDNSIQLTVIAGVMSVRPGTDY